MLNIGIWGDAYARIATYARLIHGAGDAQIVGWWHDDNRPLPANLARELAPLTADMPFQEMLHFLDLLMVVTRFGDTQADYIMQGLSAGIPTFVDWPLGGNLHTARALQEHATQEQTPLIAFSPLRYAPALKALQAAIRPLGHWESGAVAGLGAYPSLGPRAANSLFYGVPVAELLLATFGRGVQAVRTENGHHSETAIIRYFDGRQISAHFLRTDTPYYQISYYTAHEAQAAYILPDDTPYLATLRALRAFCDRPSKGIPPVLMIETIEMIALLDALERSRSAQSWVTLR